MKDERRVLVRPAPPAAVGEVVRELLRALSPAALGDAPRVLVKPNLGFDLPHPGSVTSPQVLAAVVEALVEEGREVVIIEADQVLVDIEQPARDAGVFELCDRLPGVSWVNLSRLPTRTLGGLDLPELIGTAPLVTLPVLKTHAKSVMSGALKNQWALLPLDRWRLHPRLSETLYALWQAAPPALCVVDATVGLEGDGPKSGIPRRVDHLLAGRDAPRVDAVSSRLMGIDPWWVPHLALHGRLLDDIQLDGALPDIPPFQRARHNLVSQVESSLHELPLGRLVFDTPLFDAACAGARLWYRAWHRRVAAS